MEKVKYSNRLFVELLDKMPQAVIWFTPVWDVLGLSIVDFKYAYCNEMGLKYYNFTREQVPGLLISNSPSLTDELRKTIMEELERAYHTGQKAQITLYNPIVDKYSKALRFKFRGGVLSIIQDITEENRIINELERETAYTNSILDVCLNGGFAANAIRNEEGKIVDFLILRVNPAFSQQLALSEKEVVNKHFLSVFPGTFGKEIFEASKRVIETGVPERFEMPYGNGWFYISSVRLFDGELVTFQDITEQRQATDRVKSQRNLLEKILANSAAGISLIEVIRDETGKVVDGRVILANDKAAELRMLSKEEYMLKTVIETDPALPEGPVFEQAVNTLKTGTPFHTEYYFEPSKRWLELSLARLDEDHLINIFTDITQMKSAQFELEHSLAELKHSNENLEEFAYAASHDLKEPLRKFHYFTDRLKESLKEKLSEEEKRHFERIENATQRMRQLVDDLLKYSLLSHEVAQMESVNLNQKVKRVLEDLELMIQEKQAVITVGDLPVVKGYRRQLQQLFYNLVTNSIKYSKPGEAPHIDISSKMLKGMETGLPLTREEMEKYFFEIVVRDNGIGFEQEDAERIFKVFTRLHNYTENRGTGVGLAIVHRVVENHHGYVTAESSPGNGAAFKVFLPALNPDAFIKE